jgi:hypothetical protein
MELEEKDLFMVQRSVKNTWRKDSDLLPRDKAKSTLNAKLIKADSGEKFRLVKASSYFINDFDEPIPIYIVEVYSL